MQYFFIFGNTPTLSISELLAYFKRIEIAFEIIQAKKDFLIIETKTRIPEQIMHELGGVVKYGEVIQVLSSITDLKADFLYEHIMTTDLAEGKYYFGFSVYPQDKKISYQLRGVGLELKKILKSARIASRLVMSRQENLSSVVVQKNKLLTNNGWEVVLMQSSENIYIGKTIAVQPFEDFGRRDYGRPDRDDFSGMLPPKLALSMVNLAAQPSGAVLYDPFCGSGTVIQEALLLGYTQLIGSDVSERAVHDTRENVQWLADTFDLAISNVSVQQHDATEPSFCSEDSVNAIIAEPFLGPPATHKRNQKQAQEIVDLLTPLYTKTFKHITPVLKVGGRMVLIFPVLFYAGGALFLSDDITIPASLEIAKIIPSEIQSDYRLTRKGGVLYSRAGQHVGREILVFEKK